jgi:hypothetical protein
MPFLIVYCYYRVSSSLDILEIPNCGEVLVISLLTRIIRGLVSVSLEIPQEIRLVVSSVEGLGLLLAILALPAAL